MVSMEIVKHDLARDMEPVLGPPMRPDGQKVLKRLSATENTLLTRVCAHLLFPTVYFILRFKSHMAFRLKVM